MRRALPSAALALCLVAPWLMAYTAGPTASMWPWLLSALCALGVWVGRSPLDARLLASSWLAAALISCLIALPQYWGVSDALAPWISTTPPGEAFGNLRQRNHFATLTSIGLVALLGWLALPSRAGAGHHASAGGGALERSATPLWAHAAVLLLALGNAASSSRTGLLAWLLVLALTWWWHGAGRRSPVWLALQALLVYVAASFALPALLHLLTGISAGDALSRLADAGHDSRRVLWANVLTLIGHQPWGGWGWGELDYAHFITPYAGARFSVILDNAHNLPLQVAVELGVPAALLFCGTLVWMLWRAAPWRDTDPARQMAWAVLAVMGLHSLLEFPLWYGPFQLTLGLCTAWLWATRPAARPVLKERIAVEDTHPFAPTGAAVSRRRAEPVFVLGALLALGVLGADYVRVSQLFMAPAQRLPAYREQTLAKVQDSWFFGQQVRFAALLTTELSAANASEMLALALRVMHYSPEPKVVEKLIASALLAEQPGVAALYLDRFRRAYPSEHAHWTDRNAALLERLAPEKNPSDLP